MHSLASWALWRNILDVLAVWFIFYQILLLIRGTRAFQMVIGVLVFLLVFFVSGWLKLYTLNWLITSFWSQIVLALLILFQPEIRKALARVGKSPLLLGIPLGDSSLDIEELVKALQTLSRRGIGGIIVIERNTDLSEIVEVGVPLDAIISNELLVSLFSLTLPFTTGQPSSGRTGSPRQDVSFPSPSPPTFPANMGHATGPRSESRRKPMPLPWSSRRKPPRSPLLLPEELPPRLT